jgi:hypothetical protein
MLTKDKNTIETLQNGLSTVKNAAPTDRIASTGKKTGKTAAIGIAAIIVILIATGTIQSSL